MESGSNSTLIKTLAAVTATAMLTVIMLAGIFIIIESGHECEGEHCPVCECIENCHSLLNQIGSAAVTGITTVTTYALLITICICSVRVMLKETPVSTKVRLND